jgi:hypothetical protein
MPNDDQNTDQHSDQNAERDCFMDNRTDVGGYDLSAAEYDDIFEQHQQVHATFEPMKRAKERYVEYLNALPQEQRAALMRQAYTVSDAIKIAFKAGLQMLQEERKALGEARFREAMAELMRHTPPYVLEDFLKEILSKLQEDLADVNLITFTGLAAAGLPDEQAQALSKALFVATLRAINYLTPLGQQMAIANMQWVIDGCPFWDAEKMALDKERPAVEGLPAFNLLGEEGIPSPEQQQASEQQAEQQLLVRLLDGLQMNL